MIYAHIKFLQNTNKNGHFLWFTTPQLFTIVSFYIISDISNNENWQRLNKAITKGAIHWY